MVRTTKMNHLFNIIINHDLEMCLKVKHVTGCCQNATTNALVSAVRGRVSHA